MYVPVVRLNPQSADACNRNVKRRHPLLSLPMLLSVLARNYALAQLLHTV
jgi:hypothetical protein